VEWLSPVLFFSCVRAGFFIAAAAEVFAIPVFFFPVHDLFC
jgi:hypothetical protein